VFLRLERERVHVDTRVRRRGVVLERLNLVEVGTQTLREAILAVELELGGDNRVLTPAVHAQGSLGEDDRAGHRDGRLESAVSRWSTILDTDWRRDQIARGAAEESLVTAGIRNILNRDVITVSRRQLLSSVREDAARQRRRLDLERPRGSQRLERVALRERPVVDQLSAVVLWVSVGERGAREHVDRIGVVEWLGTEHGVQTRSAARRARAALARSASVVGVVRDERAAVVNVGVRLDNPDQLLHRVVEVKLDLVRGRANRLVTRELELSDEVLVRRLSHLATLVGVEEHVVDVDRG